MTTADVTWAFRERMRDLISDGDVVVGGFHVSVPFNTEGTNPQAAAFARRIAFESNIDLFREMKKARLLRDFEVLFDIVPYIHEEGRVRSVPSIYDYMRQAEVTIMATSSDDTIDRIVALVADAGSYAPKKEPSA
jgi:MoxR-like ATPase